MKNLRSHGSLAVKDQQNSLMLSALYRIERQINDILQLQSQKEEKISNMAQDLAFYKKKLEAIRQAVSNFRGGKQTEEEALAAVEKILSEKPAHDIQKLVELENKRLRTSKNQAEDLRNCLKELGI